MPFNVGLSGLNAASADLEVISNNIANVNTTGFKGSRAEFADLFSFNRYGTQNTQMGQGVRLSNVAQQFGQGNLEYTSNGLDMAVVGEGFFTVRTGAGYAYTRAGNFQPDNAGNIVLPQGGFLQVYPPNGMGGFDQSTLTDLRIQTGQGAPSATSTATFRLNLPANATPPATTPFDPTDPTSFNESTSFTAYDSLGATHAANVYYVNTGPGAWEAHMTIDGNPAGGPIAVTFDANGAILTPAGGSVTFPPYTLANGANPLALTVDMANVTQYGDAYSMGSIVQNGYGAGNVSTIDIDNEGVVSVRYSNGQTEALGRIALADFANAQGLQKIGNTMWAETNASGQVIRGVAGTGDFGQLQSGALESSNVDLTQELVKMIKAQRNYQANAQVIQTDNTLTQTIINLRG
ncbi:flagellar hook protein FlgE [Dokdonella sp. MW10]|uniref:flagellar hook protein FlgE n=1 Tax=Dokdonella sp. MW10 TaxID=2992926 RepID=UPI003F7D4463